MSSQDVKELVSERVHQAAPVASAREQDRVRYIREELSMESPKVESREYKVMLQAAEFQGNENKILTQARAFWDSFTSAIQDTEVTPEGSLAEIDKVRLVNFFDASDRRIRNRGSFVIRARKKIDSNKRKLTLKFRHGDRYVSQDRDLHPVDGEEKDTKFEQDIKTPFRTLYSYSSKVSLPAGLEVTDLGAVGQLFPGFAPALDFYRSDLELRVVGGLTAREMVITGASLQLADSEEGSVECGLIVWHEDGGDEERPLVVEFSFRYGQADELYSGQVAQRAYEVFQNLMSLSEWVELEGPTKTAHAYSLP